MSPAPCGCILVIDDDPDILEVIELVLASHGYEPRKARHGEQALTILAEGFQPCLILLDMMMPVMNGWEFRARQLAEPRWASIPVVALSGDLRALRPEPALGAVERLAKPVTLVDLLQMVKRYCPDQPSAGLEAAEVDPSPPVC